MSWKYDPKIQRETFIYDSIPAEIKTKQSMENKKHKAPSWAHSYKLQRTEPGFLNKRGQEGDTRFVEVNGNHNSKR